MNLKDNTSPLLLDGAMGTMIQRFGLSEEDFRGETFSHSSVLLKGNNDVLNLTRPDVISEIHRNYLEAGADIISTNTFSAQRISQEEYGLSDYIAQINLEGARIAREVADSITAKTGRKRYVAGSVGPTTKLLSISSDPDHPELREISFDTLVDAYCEQMAALLEGGVDALLIETSLDAINAKAALYAAQKVMEFSGHYVPVMLSITVSDESGRVLSGQTLESFAIAVSHFPLFSIGLNCSMGAAAMATPLRRLHSVAKCRMSVHPNAGLPDRMGEYKDTPEDMASVIEGFLNEGLVDIVGGCCGTTPDHIRALRNVLDKNRYQTSKVVVSDNGNLEISGQEPLILSPGEFMNIGERCNVAGSRKFLRLIKEGNLEEAVAISRKQVEDGAMAIDINMDDGMLDAGKCMEEFVNLLSSDPVASKVPLMIDSSDFDVILRGVKSSQGKPIVNSISLKDGEEQFLKKARELRKLGAAVIVIAFDEQGQALTFDRKIEICARSYRLLVEEVGFPPSDIIFDPNILTVATGLAEHSDYAIDFVKAATWIHENLPGARVSGGLSNLSFAFRGNNKMREFIHAVFLNKAVPAGLDMAILNAASSVSFDDVPPLIAKAIDDVLFAKRDGEATERLSELALKLIEETNDNLEQPIPLSEEAVPPCEALTRALVKGSTSDVEQPLKKLLNEMSPMQIIAGPLMEGMNRVGTLFADGKIFLPQVVKTARTMKFAVDFLKPSLESAQNIDSQVSYSGTALLATVKGDVHDIGKNIVGMILSCNNFRVIDLGVMVPPETIINAIKTHHPNFLCLSGLITPSLQEMIFTLQKISREGIDIPVMIGGAATSEIHTALKMAPIYNGPVFHVKDAARNPVIGMELLDAETRDIAVTRLRERQEFLRRQAETPTQSKSTPTPPSILETPAPPLPPNLPEFFKIPVGELIPLIDWLYFFHAWKVKANSEEGLRLKEEALTILEQLASDDEMVVNAKLKFSNAKPENDIIKIDSETLTATRRKGVSLADFLRPEGEPLGLFAATTGEALRHLKEQYESKDIYRAMLLHTISDRLVEAAAQWIQDKAGWNTIRPAIGYPSLPDQTNIFRLNNLLHLDSIGIELTETGAMNPPSSIAGLIMPRGYYF